MNQTRHLTIITGASRGIGHAIAALLLEQEGQHLIGISRRSDAALAAHAGTCGSEIEQWAHDLSDPAPVAARLAD